MGSLIAISFIFKYWWILLLIPVVTGLLEK